MHFRSCRSLPASNICLRPVLTVFPSSCPQLLSCAASTCRECCVSYNAHPPCFQASAGHRSGFSGDTPPGWKAQAAACGTNRQACCPQCPFCPELAAWVAGDLYGNIRCWRMLSHGGRRHVMVLCSLQRHFLFGRRQNGETAWWACPQKGSWAGCALWLSNRFSGPCVHWQASQLSCYCGGYWHLCQQRCESRACVAEHAATPCNALPVPLTQNSHICRQRRTLCS